MSIQEAYEVSKSPSVNPFGYFIAVIKERPQVGRQQHIAAFKRLVLGRDYTDFAEAIVDEWCRLKYGTAYAAAVPPTRIEAARHATKRKRDADHRNQQAATLATAVTSKIVDLTMSFVMPSGKTLAKSTFADCAKAGGLFSGLSKLGKPRQIVGKTITNEQLADFVAGIK